MPSCGEKTKEKRGGGTHFYERTRRAAFEEKATTKNTHYNPRGVAERIKRSIQGGRNGKGENRGVEGANLRWTGGALKRRTDKSKRPGKGALEKGKAKQIGDN